MSNIFKKTDDQSKCYLIESKVFDKKTLDEDALELYNDFLNYSTISDYNKLVIEEFLLPYNISPLKWTLNEGYFSDPFPVDLENNHSHIAPSLKILKENPLNRAQGYPTWFYIAFPDVALWAMGKEGFSIISDKFKNYTEEQLIEGKFIRPEFLNEVIQMYLRNTHNSLECKKY